MDKIIFENYKAFTRGEIELRPLTILLGANSSGKSSILHLFLMLEQSINNAENYAAAFKTNGHSVNLGEDENLLKDRKHNTPLSLEFSIDANRYIEKLKGSQQDREVRANSSFLVVLKTHFPEKYNEYSDQMDILIETIKKDGSTDMSDAFNRIFKDSGDVLYQMLMQGHLDKSYAESLWRGIGDVDTFERAMSLMRSCFNDFEKAFSSEVKDASIRFEFYYSDSSKKLNVRNCTVIVDGKSLIRVNIQNKVATFESDIFFGEKLNLLRVIFNPDFSFNGLMIQSNGRDVFTEYVEALVGQAFQQVQTYFLRRNLRYVGPLRANPQRYYFLDDSNTNQSVDNRNGTSLAEILKKNTRVKEKINKWMNHFDLSVDVKEFKDVIHNIKVTQNGLVLDIPDVGFGISQVLPILVEGMMAPSKSTVIMEQPEIHLHPMMQAELADLFIDMLNLQSKEKRSITKSLIIETHSEYILKRIRRRMAEGLISPRHVAIYFVKSRGKDNPDSAQLEMVSISKDGTIDWPREFYVTEMEDELAFFQSKIAKS